jgi:hypothetical protein
MKRRQLIEIHEQQWCPSAIRDGVTDFLRFSANRWGYYTGLLPTICYFVQRSGAAGIVDLCSGGGGPWLKLHRIVGRACGEGFTVTLTDRRPNLAAFRHLEGLSGRTLRGMPQPVDCLAVPPQLKGFRTMFESFHHFPPESARRLLQNAVDAAEGIAICEMTSRRPTAVLATAAASAFVFLHTPAIRPFRWSRIFFTYFLPLIPLALLWDGIVSCFRTYTVAELEEMAASLGGARYEWEFGTLRSPGSPFEVLYAVGCPAQEEEQPCC